VAQELRHAGRENLDPGHVALYDEKEDANATAEVRRLLKLGLDARSTVIDLGAGTGQFTLAVAPRCRSVVAVDVSLLMVERLEAKLATTGYDNVDVVLAGFLTYEHDRDPVDFVYSRWALHHLDDAWKAMALDRIRHNLRPGGVLRLLDIAYSFAPAEMSERVEQWRSTLPVTAETEGTWVQADIDEHVRDEHSTFTWLLEPMIERTGFRIEEAEHSPDGFFAEYVARAV
jgi:SAM-dependent methyltransferase